MNLTEAWQQILENLRHRHAGDLPYLRGVRPALEGDALVLHPLRASVFIREQLEDAERCQRLAAAAAEVLGRAVTVRVAKAENGSASREGNAVAILNKQRQEACEHSAVKMLLRHVRGNIVDVREVYCS